MTDNEIVERRFKEFLASIPQPDSVQRMNIYFDLCAKFTKIYQEMKLTLLDAPKTDNEEA